MRRGRDGLLQHSSARSSRTALHRHRDHGARAARGARHARRAARPAFQRQLARRNLLLGCSRRGFRKRDMNHRPPSAARALWILARLLLRRRLNFLMSAGLMRRLSGRRGAGRIGTPTKSGGRLILGAVLAPILFLNGVILASACITNLSIAARGASEASGKLVVTSFTYSQLCEVESAMHRLARDADSPEGRRLKDLWNRYLDDLFAGEVRMEFLSEDQERARLAEMRRVFERDGTAGFEAGPGISLTVAGDAWPRSAAAAGAFLNALGVILLLWVPTMICMSLGLNNKDLGQVEWSFQWLFTFPVPARTLFASRMLSFAFLNPLVWGFLLPFAIMVYVGAGFALAAIAIGTIATLYLTLLTGALTCLIEVWLRRALSLKGLKNVQALFTIVGTLCFFLFYAITFSPRTIRSLVHALASIPGSWIWNPFSAPLMLGMPDESLIRTAFIAIEMLEILGGSRALTLAGPEWLTRPGRRPYRAQATLLDERDSGSRAASAVPRPQPAGPGGALPALPAGLLPA